MQLVAGDNTINVNFRPEIVLANLDLYVTDADTGSPVYHVLVYIDNQFIAYTNYNGYLGIEGLSVGYHSGLLRKSGYEDTTF